MSSAICRIETLLHSFQKKGVSRSLKKLDRVTKLSKKKSAEYKPCSFFINPFHSRAWENRFAFTPSHYEVSKKKKKTKHKRTDACQMAEKRRMSRKSSSSAAALQGDTFPRSKLQSCPSSQRPAASGRPTREGDIKAMRRT